MRKNTLRISTYLCLVLIISLIYPAKVFADIGPKPTITIIVTGYEDKDYLLDLLVTKEVRYEKDKPKDEKELDLYNYNEEGWKALYLRSDLLSGSLKGEYDSEKEKMIHRFGYMPPKTFKVIVRKNNGDMIVSNEVTPNQFDAVVTFDLKEGKAEVVKKNLVDKVKDMAREHHFLSLFLLVIVFPIVSTIIIEIIIALFFRIKEFKIIFWANLLTQILLQITFRGIIDSRHNYYLNLFLLEIAVFFIEYFIYKRSIKSVNNKKIIWYTFTANIITYISGLFFFKIY